MYADNNDKHVAFVVVVVDDDDNNDDDNDDEPNLILVVAFCLLFTVILSGMKILFIFRLKTKLQSTNKQAS